MQVHPPSDSRRPWGESETPYEELGGDPEVRRLVERFYDIVEETSPVLTAMLPADTRVSRQKLYEFLSGWMGGPPLYWERRGHPALRMRHAPFTIDRFAAEEWARCMAEAITDTVSEPALAGFLSTELGTVALQLQNA